MSRRAEPPAARDVADGKAGGPALGPPALSMDARRDCALLGGIRLC